ncbi:thioesterase II family protein [Priestia megaterium]|uniref:thioesterase II family protein n=1 Tax=Priestia megaterium TaxID=1404 RepID=UPI003EE9ECF4
MSRLKLFCFPYAGGSSSFYREWKFNSQDIEVIPMEYPGHGRKYGELLCNNISQLTDLLLEEMNEKYHIDSLENISFFGHSMGAIVAYEIAMKLEERFDNSVEYLFLSSKSSPNHKLEHIDFSNIHKLKQSLRKMGGTNEELMETDDFMNLFLPIIQSDLNMLLNYEETKRPKKLNSKAILLLGSEDSVSKESMESWNQYITHIKELYILKGDHFYLNHNQDTVLKIVRNYLVNHEAGLVI